LPSGAISTAKNEKCKRDLENIARIPQMAEMPESKSALRRLAASGMSAAKRAARITAERKERRAEVLGALFLIPLARDMLPQVPVLGSLGLDKRLELAVGMYAVASFTTGWLQDAAWGATLGAVGAYAYAQDDILGGLVNTNGK
jgi:hypothetical protein